jgi:S-adenosylmethionine decarboxylase
MKHILFTLKGCPFDLLDDEEFIRMVLFKASKECNSTLLDLTVHKFEPQGVTGIAMLAESHLSIHTWPENGMAVCDVFTCGDSTEPEKAVEYMQEQLKATDIVSEIFTRPLK